MMSGSRTDGRSWRLRLPAGGLLASLILSAAAESSAQERPPIPSHPSRLQFQTRPVEVPRAEPLTHRLSNGTRVVIVEDHTLPLVDVTIALLAGTFLDPPERPGLAELTGSMVRRGGTARRSADAFDQAVDVLGARIDSLATATRAGASLDCLTETLEESLDLFFEMLSRPAFDARRLDGIRSNLLAGFRARNDDPLAMMEREWSWLLVGEAHYLGRRLTAADLSAITRRDLVEFHARHWRPERAVLAVSGDVRADRVLALLEAGIERWTKALPRSASDDLAWPPADEAREAAPGLYLADHPAEQAKVSIGHGIPPITDWLSRDTAALEVANEILGGTRGQISRINGRLRAKGWVYRALSELDTGQYEPGSFRVFLDASPENVMRAVEVCLEEIDRLIDSGVTPEVLAIVRGELLSALALRFDTAEETAGYFAEDLLLGRPHEYWYDYAERLRSLKAPDVRSAAARYLDPDRLKVLVVSGGDEISTGGIRAPRLVRWLEHPHRLPPRDPVTLRPAAAP